MKIFTLLTQNIKIKHPLLRWTIHVYVCNKISSGYVQIGMLISWAFDINQYQEYSINDYYYTTVKHIKIQYVIVPLK